MTWNPEGNKFDEASKIRWEIVPYTKGKVLDLGCGPFKAFTHFIGVDNGADEGYSKHYKPDVRVDTCEKLDVFASQSFDAVFSSHLLEHIENYQAALKEWYRVVKVGGYVVLYLPDEDEYPKVGTKGANIDHKWNVNYDRVVEAMPGAWDLVDFQKRNQEEEYSLFFVFKKTNSGRNFSWKKPKPEKTCAVVRYGGIGDMIQTASVFPLLKEQGYHITVYTSDVGEEVMRHDPYVDRFIVQSKNQVPNNELMGFWGYTQKKYDKWINFSESVEGTWLAMTDRASHRWPHAVRHKYLNQNYLEFMHELAEVPFKPNPKFYPTAEETKWAKSQKKGFTILWALAGSSVHKSWPHIDAIWARLMLRYPDCQIVTTGDMTTQILEAGWENEKRIVKRAGKWSIRQTLAFATVADLVVGPETGVLNAVSHLQIPKILFLSHSSVENLSRDWVNTTNLLGNASCYPCHMLHYNWDHCRKHEETATAMCQHEISPDKFWTEFEKVMLCPAMAA
jgi:ADP-heptose:LPS heptosyltransferase/predicted SAM-dependent methyltransferase